TDRGDYREFHVRIEARITAGGDSGIIFRAPFPDSFHALGAGYEAQISCNSNEWQTGSILCPHDVAVARPAAPRLTRQDEWFLLEVIVRGNEFETRVNGQTALKVVDARGRFRMGHIALQQKPLPQGNSVVQFR